MEKIIKTVADVDICIAPVGECSRGALQMTQRMFVLEILCGYLGVDCQLHHRPDGSPYIDHPVNISISHSRNHVAVAFCRDRPIGIDVESWRPALRRVSRRVLSDAEQRVFVSDESLLCAWTIKEAVYKIVGAPAYNFADDISIDPDMLHARSDGRCFKISTFTIGCDTITIAMPV